MSNSRRIIKNIAWMSVAEIATKGMSFFTNAYLARIILEEGFGYINFATATVLYFATFVALGFNAVGAREIAREPQQVKRYVDSIITIRLLLTVISYIALAVFILIAGLSERQTTIVLIASVTIFTSALMLDWYFQGVERMDILGFRQIILAVINLAGVLLFVRSPKDIEIAMYVLSGSVALNTFWMLGVYIKWNGMFKPNFDFKFWKKLFRSAIPISITHICILVLSNISILLLGIMLVDSERIVGLYTAAIKIAVLLIMPITIIQVAFYPHFSRSETIESKVKAFDKYLLLNLIVGFFATSLVYFFADFFILLIYGSRYLDASSTLSILMIYIAISFISQTAMHPMVAWKKEKIVMVLVGISAIVNVVLNYLLIPTHEMIGAAIASLATELVLAVAFLTAIIKITKHYPFGNLLKVLVIAVACTKSAHLISEAISSDIIGILFAVSSYIIIIFGFKIVTINEIKGYLKR